MVGGKGKVGCILNLVFTLEPKNVAALNVVEELFGAFQARVEHQFEILPLQSGATNVFLAVFVGKFFCFCPKLIKVRLILSVLLTCDGGKGIFVNVHASACSHFGGLVDILTQIRPPVTVVGFEELIHVCVVFFVAHIGVPHQLGKKIRAHFAKLARNGLAVALREHSAHVVVNVKAHILAQRAKVCVGGNVELEVGGVIPNIDAVADFTPLYNVVYEARSSCPNALVRALGQRMHKTATNRTKTNTNVGERFCNLGSGLGIVISQRIHNDVRIIFSNICCDGIDKAEHITRGTAFLFINRLTLLAGEAAILDNGYYMDNCKRIIETREYTKKELEKLGFYVTDSKANFIFAKSDDIGGEELYLSLKARGILVRHFTKQTIKEFNRITIGTREQMEIFVGAVGDILKEKKL